MIDFPWIKEENKGLPKVSVQQFQNNLHLMVAVRKAKSESEEAKVKEGIKIKSLTETERVTRHDQVTKIQRQSEDFLRGKSNRPRKQSKNKHKKGSNKSKPRVEKLIQKPKLMIKTVEEKGQPLL